MQDVYEKCPQFEDENYLLRFVSINDCLDLLKVYSDKKAVKFFNSDNCGGDDFYYTTAKRMQEAINYWFREYDRKGFVRWAIIDKQNNEAIGTIELFHRKPMIISQIAVCYDWICTVIMKHRQKLKTFYH